VRRDGQCQDGSSSSHLGSESRCRLRSWTFRMMVDGDERGQAGSHWGWRCHSEERDANSDHVRRWAHRGSGLRRQRANEQADLVAGEERCRSSDDMHSSALGACAERPWCWVEVRKLGECVELDREKS
jgi:hypothetical protein